MKRLLTIFVLLFSIFLFFPKNVFADNNVKLYLFTSNTCSHCKRFKTYLNDNINKYKDVDIIEYEISDSENYQLLLDTLDYLNIKDKGTPFILAGSKYLIGFNDNMILEFDELIDYARYNKVRDVIGEINGTSEYFDEVIDNSKFNVGIPIIGDVNVNNINMPASSFILGLFSSYNLYLILCLFFTLSFIFGLKEKKIPIIMLLFGISSVMFANLITYGLLRINTNIFFCFLCALFGCMIVYYYLSKIKKLSLFNTNSFILKNNYKIKAVFFIIVGLLISVIISLNDNLLLLESIFIFKKIDGILLYLYSFIYLIGFILLSCIITGIYNILCKKGVLNSCIKLVIMIICIVLLIIVYII